MASPTYTRASVEFSSKEPLIHMSINLPSHMTASGVVKMYAPPLAACVRTEDPYMTFREVAINLSNQMCLLGKNNSLFLSRDSGVRHFDVKIVVPDEKKSVLTTFFVDLYSGNKAVFTEKVQIAPQVTKSVSVNFSDSSSTDTAVCITAKTFIERQPKS